MNKHLIIIGIATTTIVVIIAILFFLFFGGGIARVEESWGKFWAREYTVTPQLFGSYTVDTSKLREEEDIKENTQFTYFVVSSMDSVLERRMNYGLQYHVYVPDDLISALALENEDMDVIFTFGRKLKEVKFSTYGYYLPNDTMRATKVIFFEEYQDDVMYVYLAKATKKLSSNWSETYYVIKDSGKVEPLRNEHKSAPIER